MPDRVWEFIRKAGDIARTVGAIIGVLLALRPPRSTPANSNVTGETCAPSTPLSTDCGETRTPNKENDLP